MIFLIPLLLVIAVVFGIDYLYFDDKADKKEIKTEQNEQNLTLEEQKQEYIRGLFEKR